MHSSTARDEELDSTRLISDIDINLNQSDELIIIDDNDDDVSEPRVDTVVISSQPDYRTKTLAKRNISSSPYKVR